MSDSDWYQGHGGQRGALETLHVTARGYVTARDCRRTRGYVTARDCRSTRGNGACPAALALHPGTGRQMRPESIPSGPGQAGDVTRRDQAVQDVTTHDPSRVSSPYLVPGVRRTGPVSVSLSHPAPPPLRHPAPSPSPIRDPGAPRGPPLRSRPRGTTANVQARPLIEPGQSCRAYRIRARPWLPITTNPRPRPAQRRAYKAPPPPACPAPPSLPHPSCPTLAAPPSPRRYARRQPAASANFLDLSIALLAGSRLAGGCLHE